MIKLNVVDFNAFAHLQKRIRLLAKNTYTTPGWINDNSDNTNNDRGIFMHAAYEVCYCHKGLVLDTHFRELFNLTTFSKNQGGYGARRTTHRFLASLSQPNCPSILM